MLDKLLKGGTLIDGTGAPRRVADVGIKDDRVVAIGNVDESATETIDVSGLVVAPGFVDIHTHYDAQVLWDPFATPSSSHGVTTVVGGNCGFTIAPMRPEHTDYIVRMLSLVEGMPLDSLRAGVKWNWGSFGKFLDQIEGRAGVNMGFLVGHSTLRRLAMGEAATDGPAKPDDIAAMTGLLHESLSDGALGFSSSWGPAHFDGDGDPVPSRFANQDELFALAEATGQHPGTVLEFNCGIPGLFGDHEVETLIGMSKRANRSVNWNTLRVLNDDDAFVDEQLNYSTRADKAGAQIRALTYPELSFVLITLSNPMLWSSLPNWLEVMELPIPERIRRLRDPEVRTRLKAGGVEAQNSPSPFVRATGDFGTLFFAHTVLPQNAGLIDRCVAEVARERNQHPLDVVLDVATAEGLDTYFQLRLAEEADERLWQKRAEVWRDKRTIVGASDAGAHLDSTCGARYTTSLVGPSVRDRKLLSLEEAVHLITDRPARFYGIRGRGRVATGWFADIVVFDPDRINYRPIAPRHDFPAGAKRLYTEAVGVHHVFVNGKEVVRENNYTGDLPGTVLRSHRDLDTMPVRV